MRSLTILFILFMSSCSLFEQEITERQHIHGKRKNDQFLSSTNIHIDIDI